MIEGGVSMKKTKLFLQLYITFLKVGLMSFGGGYAAISLIEKEVVEVKKWVDKEKIVDIFAVAQSLPGAIALNSSAFIGYSIAGIRGAIAALVGNLTSPVIIVLILSIVYGQIKDYPSVSSAFTGIYPVIIALVLYAGYKIGKTAVKDAAGVIIMLCALYLALFAGVSPIPLIISGAAAGIIITTVKNLLAQRHKKDTP